MRRHPRLAALAWVVATLTNVGMIGYIANDAYTAYLERVAAGECSAGLEAAMDRYEAASNAIDNSQDTAVVAREHAANASVLRLTASNLTCPSWVGPALAAFVASLDRLIVFLDELAGGATFDRSTLNETYGEVGRTLTSLRAVLTSAPQRT